MSDPHPIFDPIEEGIFDSGTPLTHQRRVEESCSECDATTPHDYFEAILGLHFGFGLPFGRKRTAGKLGRRSNWAFCAICGAATPLDEAAANALQKAGVASPELSLEEVARELAMQISQGIADDYLEELSKFGVDPADGSHKLEILLLALHSLRVAAQQALGYQESVALVDYTEQLVGAVYTEVLKYPAEAYDEAMARRFTMYDEIITDERDMSSKIQSIGLCFTEALGSADPALMLWASQMYVGWTKANVEFLTNLNGEYELVP